MTGAAAQVIALKSCSLAGGSGLEAVPATALAGCSALRSVTLNNCDLVRPPAFLAAARALRSLSLAGAPPPLLSRGIREAGTAPLPAIAFSLAHHVAHSHAYSACPSSCATQLAP